MSENALLQNQIADRYAGALFELAKEKKLVKTIEKDLFVLLDVFEKSAEAKAVFFGRLTPIPVAKKIFALIADKAKLHKYTINLLMMLIDNQRAFTFYSIIDHFLDHKIRDSNQKIAVVESAEKLKPTQETKLKTLLSDKFKKAIQIEARVNPELLAGLKITVGTWMIDTTLKTKFEKLYHTMKGTP